MVLMSPAIFPSSTFFEWGAEEDMHRFIHAGCGVAIATE
jgi:hypothetical protein